MPTPAAPAHVALAITDTLPSQYEWDVLAVGKSIHVDDQEKLTAVPGKYKGLKFLRTASTDRYLSAPGAVAFRTNREVAVLVAYDTRTAGAKPGWLATWEDTGDTLTTSAAVLGLYRRTFASGAVALGGNELGVSTYTVVVDDGTALGNAPPSIAGDPPSAVSANRLYEFQPTTTDADGDPLVFTAANLPAWLALDPATGRLAGTPAASAISTYGNIVLEVSDGDATASLPPFAITVGAPPTNSAPTIFAPPVPAGTQWQPFAFQPVASDPDGDVLSFTIANAPRWASFDTSSGRLAGTPGNGDVGTDVDVSIAVSDGKATTTLPPFDIRVFAPGESGAPGTNTPPQIHGAPSTTVLAGTAYGFTATATDPDDDPLTFSIANRPAWATFTSAGQLFGTPGPGDVGTYADIRISVSDGEATMSLGAFGITVVAVTAGSATLSWTPPTRNTDGTPLSNLAGYRIYWGPSRGQYSSSVTVNAGLSSYVVEQLTPGTWYFVLTAFNTHNVESAFSNEASKIIP